MDCDLQREQSHPQFKCKSAEWRLLNICLGKIEVQLCTSHALTGDNPKLKISRILKIQCFLLCFNVRNYKSGQQWPITFFITLFYLLKPYTFIKNPHVGCLEFYGRKTFKTGATP